jgi:hypothetical protein
VNELKADYLPILHIQCRTGKYAVMILESGEAAEVVVQQRGQWFEEKREFGFSSFELTFLHSEKFAQTPWVIGKSADTGLDDDDFFSETDNDST